MLLEQLRIARHSAQWLLQVVRRDTRKMFELGVGTFELRRAIFECALRVLERADVHGVRHEVERCTPAVADDGDRHEHPDGVTLLVQIALLEHVSIDFSVNEATRE